jgi:hypothetical protein
MLGCNKASGKNLHEVDRAGHLLTARTITLHGAARKVSTREVFNGIGQIS